MQYKQSTHIHTYIYIIDKNNKKILYHYIIYIYICTRFSLFGVSLNLDMNISGALKIEKFEIV